MMNFRFISVAFIWVIVVLSMLILILITLFFLSLRRCNNLKIKQRNMNYFLSMVSHDLKSPLQGIKGYITLSKMQKNDEEKISQYLRSLEDISLHMEELVNDLLDYSKIEKGKLELKYKPTQIMHILNRCVSCVEAQAKLYGITLKTNYQIKHSLVLIDELRIDQILINLLNNAIKYTKDKEFITFSVQEVEINEDQSKFIFIINDSGIGMNHEVLSHLFEPFVLGKESLHTDLKSTGLGLFLVKKMVDMMKGEISVHSVEGKGSSFEVSFVFELCNDIY